MIQKFWRNLWAQASDPQEVKGKVSEVAQSCPTHCDPVDCSPPGSFLHGILQARILEWVAISFSRGSSQPRDRTGVSYIPGRRFNLSATREAQEYWSGSSILSSGKLPHPGIEPGSLALQDSLPAELPGKPLNPPTQPLQKLTVW